MSKFFNETLRARNVLFPVEAPNPIDLPAASAAVISAEEPESPATPSSWLDECRPLQLPLGGRLREAFKGSDWLESAEESYRSLRTKLLRMRSDRELRSIILTSSTQGEGKTLTSFNLAVSCSQIPELKVLVIDSDLRNAGLTRLLGSPPSPGLCDLLLGEASLSSAIMRTDSPNLYVLPAGQSAGPPAELLAKGKWPELMASFYETFDLVVVDSPPILNLADVELLAPACDGMLMVVRAGHVRRDVLEKSAAQLNSKKLLGVVYNGADGASYPRYYYGS